MPRTYADLVDLVESKLQDSANAEFIAADINYDIEECLKEIAHYEPHIVEVKFALESRQGSASSTSANNLVDANKSQFVSTDPTNEKVVYNDTDKTWATITSYSSTSQVGLSADIMASGEVYYIFNKRCRNSRQIFIGDSWDYTEVLRAEYPTNYWPRRWRNVKLIGRDILELKLDRLPDDSNPTLTGQRTEVIVQFNRPHILSQLTDWAAEVNFGAGYTAGVTSMVLDGLQASGTIEEGEEFYIENLRQLYTVTADATIAANAATISFYPGLESAVVDNDDITFVKSSLTQGMEEILAKLIVGRLAIDKAPKFANAISLGGGAVWQTFLLLGRQNRDEALAELRANSTPRTNRQYPRV